MKKKLDYRCINGASHDYTCCETCWNTHPVAEKYFAGKDFRETGTYKRLRLRYREREFKAKARRAGFTDSEADFLFKRI